MFKCLCGNQIIVQNRIEPTRKELVYKGDSTDIMGYSLSVVTVCDKCKKELNVEFVVMDNNCDLEYLMIS